jgi:REP element-mobilizing transposase RayT
MATLPDRETSRLRFGRQTAAEACYFITLCTKDRTPVLTTTDTGSVAAGALQSLQSTGDIQLIAATLMPDHAHLLFQLGDRLRVGQVMGKFKAWSRDMGQAPWRWQHDGFEHRLRRSESIDDYGFYIFMNPYRAGLCPLTDPWPWWLCPEPSVFRFLTALDRKQAVPAAWLGLSAQVGSRITTGDRPPVGSALVAGPGWRTS